MKVFLSHSSRDKALVREIRSYLPRHITTWLDEDDLLVGMDLKVSIRNAIQEAADYVVIFLGREAVRSEWVKEELQWALDREREIGRVFILPVLLDEVWDEIEPASFKNRLYLKCLDQSERGVKAFAEKLSEQIYVWLSKYLDDAKAAELKKQQEAEALRHAVQSLVEAAQKMTTEVPEHWLADLRNTCVRLKSLEPDLQLERLISKVENELGKWRKAKEDAAKNREDEKERSIVTVGLTLYSLSCGKMIDILEECSEEIEMWKAHSSNVSAEQVIQRVYSILGVE